MSEEPKSAPMGDELPNNEASDAIDEPDIEVGDGLPVAEPDEGSLTDGWEPADSVPAAAAAEAVQHAEDRFLRLAAEYDNYRKRTIREKAEAFDRGAGDLVARLVDELDDVDRLLESDPETTDYEAFRHGFELFSKKLAKELSNAGVERIDPVGQKFDPEEHEAVSIVTPEDPADDDKVAATFVVGYRFRGTVLRHAKVQVWTVDGSI